MSVQARRWAGLFGFLLAVGLVVAGLVLNQGVAGRPGLSHPEAPTELVYYLVMLAISTVALSLVWLRPDNSVGWFLGLSGLIGVICETGQVYGARALVVEGSALPAGAVVLALSSPLWIPALFLPGTLLLARYPTGRLSPGRARAVDRCIRWALVAVYVGYASMPEAVTDEVSSASNPLLLPAPVRGPLLLGGGLVVLLGFVVVLAMSVRRLLRAGYPERQQLSLLVTTTLLAVVMVMALPWEWLSAVAFTLLPVSVAVGVLRYRLLGIEVVIRRTLLYGSLTAGVLLVFIALTSALHRVIPDGTTPQVLAAVVVAVLLAPARDRLQRMVDQFVYGDRADPLRALDRLSKEAVGAEALQDVVAAIAQSLRVQGAQVRGRDETSARWGELVEPLTTIPLTVGADDVGELVVAPRRGERALGGADEKLLTAIAPLLALVLRSTSLAEALRVERERVVEATQSERARLRRDLHDGLGPSLTGIGLGLEAVDQPSLPARSQAVVSRLREEVATSLEEVRRIIDDLRPGGLEQQNLLQHVRDRSQQLTTSTPVRVEVVAPASLPPLPGDVEVAALRILDEAVTNVVRHARARTCTVTVAADEALRLEVRDDGIGYRGPREGGVGLGSMSDRARALGGSFAIEAVDGGTVLTVELPVAVPA